MDLNSAVQFGQLVDCAYAVNPTDLTDQAGKTVNAGLIGGGVAYQVIASIYANDLATDMNPSRGENIVSIGLILQAVASGDTVIAIRGTEGIQEWVQDAKFLALPCPFLPGAGNTEDGFTAVYNSMITKAAAGSLSVAKALPALPWPKPGHLRDHLRAQLRRRARDASRSGCGCEHSIALQQPDSLHLRQPEGRRPTVRYHVQPRRSEHHPDR